VPEFHIGDRVTILPDVAYRFGGAIGEYAKSGVAGEITGCTERWGELRFVVTFPPKRKHDTPEWTELSANEIGAD
jgi:hypothetical protein